MDSTYNMDYKPRHPSLISNYKNTLEDHFEAVEHLNDIPEAKKEAILQCVEESMPITASKHETAIWCHIQHALAVCGVLRHPINVYVCYQLEKNMEREAPGFLEEIFEQFK